jgi:hypothetical protein
MAERFEPRCWRFFAARFQFLRANQPAGAVYDYYLIWGG